MFKPEPFSNRPPHFSSELIAYAVDAELEYARTDEMSVRFPYGSSLRRSLARLEAISTASIAGPTPDVRLMVWLLGQDVVGNRAALDKPAPPFTCSPSLIEATRAAFRYGKAIEKISTTPQGFALSESDFIAVHAYLTSGNAPETEAPYRRTRLLPPKEGAAETRAAYRPPDPEKIPPLMKDLFAYLSVPQLTPCLQAAVAHFQLQAICPFQTSMDRIERYLALAILHRRGLSKHLIPTIGFPLASGYDNYTRLLMPYRHASATDFELGSALEMWARCCIDDLKQSTQVVRTYMRQLRKVAESYQQRIGSYRQGSTVDMLIRELPGLPLLDSSIAMELTGRGFTAVSEALDKLVECGILKQVGSTQRNRLFEAPEVVQTEQNILDTMLPSPARKHAEPHF